MAELMLRIGRGEKRQPTSYQDGDIICAPNDRRIKQVHAQHICHPGKVGFNRDGLRPAGSLPQLYAENVWQYRFNRVSMAEVIRTELATQKETPVEGIDVVAYLRRATAAENHMIFGTAGSEYWDGGRKRPASVADLATIWSGIEARTPYREADYTRWPWSDYELRGWFAIAVDDFTDEARGELEMPRYDYPPNTPGVKVNVVSKASHRVVWRDLPGLSSGTRDDVFNRAVRVDIRDAVTFQRSQIVIVKDV
jgi:hypothetical protein